MIITLTDGLSTELTFSALRVLMRGLSLPLLGDESGGMLIRLWGEGEGGGRGRGGGKEGGGEGGREGGNDYKNKQHTNTAQCRITDECLGSTKTNLTLVANFFVYNYIKHKRLQTHRVVQR